MKSPFCWSAYPSVEGSSHDVPENWMPSNARPVTGWSYVPPMLISDCRCGSSMSSVFGSTPAAGL
jgi:hypothetical protein